jgi:hypothetical protein
MDNINQILMLKERIFVIDLFLQTYESRIVELKQDRERHMKEIVELRLTPIVEVQ